MFQDYLFYGTDVEMRYAYRMLNMSALAQKAQFLHGLSQPRAQVLAEGLVASVLLSSLLDEEERIQLKIQCAEDFVVSTETTRLAETRGYVSFGPPTPELAELDAGQGFQGEIFVRSLRSQSGSNKLFEGVSRCLAKSIEFAVNDHLDQSFQVSSRLKLQSWTDPADGGLRAVGVVYLELPGLAQNVGQELNAYIDALPSMKQLYLEAGEDPDKLARRLIPHETRAIKSIQPRWSCSCSQTSIEGMLVSLGAHALGEMADDAKPVEVKCHYCSTNYEVGLPRLQELLQELRMQAKAAPKGTLPN